jgi:hypothetical protein
VYHGSVLRSLWLVLVACADDAAPTRERAPDRPLDPGPAEPREAGPPALETPVVDALAPLLITDPGVLTALEARGLALHDVLASAGPETDRLFDASDRYRAFVGLVALDDSLARWRDPSAVVGLRGSHRLFDPGWLDSPVTRFELAAVVNRIDRRHTTTTGCGETRLVYRLAYGRGAGGSRLPMTLNVVLPQPDDCRAVGRKWLALERATDLAGALVGAGGPLAQRPEPMRFEVNFQSGRWPAGVRPSLGGHAEYVLRVFTLDRGEVQIGTLENTPTQKLHFDEGATLRRWLGAHASEIDTGYAILPPEFLAERSVSVQPRGFVRYANRPFSQSVGDAPRAFGALDFGSFESFSTPEGMLRRLDQMSCKGCHSTRSVAGFHILGADRAGTSPYNAIAVGISPHLRGELPWRRRYLEATIAGDTVAARPFAERADGGGGVGAACGLGDPTFARWTCDPGLVCKERYHDGVGTCAPEDGNHAGDGVESGTMSEDRRGLNDVVRNVRVEPCLAIDGRPAEVARSADGFPGGMCYASCPTLGAIDGERICGTIPNGQGTEFDGFTRCLAEHAQSFDVCLADDSHPVWLRRCDFDVPCRDDYLCVSVPGGPTGQGACLPPYFLFQVRVDGHRVGVSTE